MEKERETYTKVLAKELKAVGKQPIFGKYAAQDIQIGITTQPKDFHAGLQTAALCSTLSWRHYVKTGERTHQSYRQELLPFFKSWYTQEISANMTFNRQSWA
jgi:hypothetical protein